MIGEKYPYKERVLHYIVKRKEAESLEGWSQPHLLFKERVQHAMQLLPVHIFIPHEIMLLLEEKGYSKK